jgi:hypothetical protein
MPTPFDATDYSKYKGLMGPTGLVSKGADAANIAGAASSGSKLFGVDPASILFSLAVNAILNRGDKDRAPAVPQTPEGQANELYNYLQSTEAQTQQAGDTEGRDAQYQALYDRAAELGMTDMAGELAQNPYVTNYAANPVVAAQSAADTLLSQIKDFFPFYDQSQLVLNPVTGTGNIVFGTPPAGQPVIQAGNLPRSNTNVGVTTGIPILDQAINSVLSKPGGLKDSGSIRGAVIAEIAKQSGLDPATTATILGKDLETILATANADVANAATKLGVDLTGEKKDDVVVDTPPVVKEDPTPYDMVAGDAGTFNVDGIGPVKMDTSTVDTPYSVVAGDAGTFNVDGVGPIQSGIPTPGTLTPADLGEGPGTVEGVVTGTVGTGGGGTATPVTPTPSQGMRMEATQKAGLAEIDNTFDPSSTFMENLMRALSGKDDTESEGSYYSGGKVAPYAGVDEIIRLLRG